MFKLNLYKHNFKFFIFYFSTLLHHTYLLNIGVHVKLSIYILQPYIKIHLKHMSFFLPLDFRGQLPV